MDGRHVRRGARVEDEQARTVLADHVLRERFAGGVGGEGREAFAEVVAHQPQVALVAGDADDAGTGGDERGGDRAPEAAAAPVTTAVWKRSDIGHSESVVGSVRIKTGRHREIRRRRLSDLHHISTASAVRSRVRVRE
ncbi:hypothetical protein LUX32_33700 [Actinomadura madurae]|nr:hypothetical protein [Actinomadura madurae]MCP9982034.1 hypothetical protein [Actinomadura madurae]